MSRFRAPKRLAACFFVGATDLASISSLAPAATYTPVDLYTMTTPAGLTYPSGLSTQGGQVVGFATTAQNLNQGLYWTASGTPIEMTPTNLSGYSTSVLEGIGATQQVGWGGGTATGYTSTNDEYHAMLWSGTAGSAIDLNPSNLSGFTVSTAFATDGTNQVGYGIGSDTFDHALLWSGSAASTVNLQPTNNSSYFASIAYGVSGNQQVGVVYGRQDDASTPEYAALWSGTAASVVNLTPTSGFFSNGTVATGIGGGQEVGWGSYNAGNSYTNALLWNGTAASVVNLNPAGYSNTIALATNGSQQVGYASIPGEFDYIPNAMVWSGTAASAVNLQSLLPANFASSTAYSLDAAGDVFGVAGDISGNYHAVEWIAPAHTATGTVVGGANQSVTVAGRSPTAGDLQVNFSSATAGTVTNVSGLSTSSALAGQTAPIDFALPTNNSLVQTWDISFSGNFTGPATMAFQYDPSDLIGGIDSSNLDIEQFSNGQWVQLSGLVNPANDTITVSTNSFSEFALAIVPEPGIVPILAVCAAGLLCCRSRKHARI